MLESRFTSELMAILGGLTRAGPGDPGFTEALAALRVALGGAGLWGLEDLYNVLAALASVRRDPGHRFGLAAFGLAVGILAHWGGGHDLAIPR